jgi:hypothetical protein
MTGMRQVFLKIFVGYVIAAAPMAGADSAVGVWKLNPAKSSSTSANSVKSRTEEYQVTPGGGVKITRTDQRADGSVSNYSYAFRCDGKEYPVTGALYDTVSCRRLNADTTTMEVRKSHGKLRIVTRNVVSNDGKTKTQINKGIDVDGKSITSSYVYDKQ